MSGNQVKKAIIMDLCPNLGLVPVITSLYYKVNLESPSNSTMSLGAYKTALFWTLFPCCLN